MHPGCVLDGAVVITDDQLESLAPLMRGRVLRAAARIDAAGGELHAVSVTRTYALQKRLRYLYTSGQRKIEAADPDAIGAETPWGWRIRGSAHMEQPDQPDPAHPDGDSWAIDLAWSGISDADAVGILDDCGLGQTVPNEWWHFQCFAGTRLFEDRSEAAPVPQLISPDEENPMHVHQARQRPGAPTIYDFTYLPDNGQTVGAYGCSSWLVIRPEPPVGRPVDVLVYFGGQPPATFTIPENGATIGVPVTHGGLCSVESPVPLACEARELWLRA